MESNLYECRSCGDRWRGQLFEETPYEPILTFCRWCGQDELDGRGMPPGDKEDEDDEDV